MRLFVGLHQPSDLKHFNNAFISINRLRGKWGRKAPLDRRSRKVIDSGAFTELDKFGRYRHSVEQYADDAAPWCDDTVEAIVAQDYMCEPFILAKTGMTVADHQRLTIERYDELLNYWTLVKGKRTHVMPVLQGWTVEDYVTHLRAYGDRLTPGMWVGVGSVCKRQKNPKLIVAILRAIKEVRPDLRLHGFWREAYGAHRPRSGSAPAHGGQHGLVV